MAEITNLTERIENALPAELVEFMQEAGLVAAGEGQNLYLACGMVRDLLLGRPSRDIDLVVEGDAIALARRLSGINQAKVIAHPRFGTATLSWGDNSVDIATARSESYAVPGALPSVKPASIEADLFRRDFTINTLAACLAPGRWGEIIDLFGGQADLEKGLIRVLHEGSFIDDATRLWRALRYEQRFGFRLERRTLHLFKRDLSMLETITPERIRHELELALAEEAPEKIFLRADRLGALATLHPGLKGDAWLARLFRQARRATAPGSPAPELYLALLAWRLTAEESEKLISGLRLRKSYAAALRDGSRIRQDLDRLAEPDLPPSAVFNMLEGRTEAALTAALLAAEQPSARRNIRLFLDRLRRVRTSLSGRDLQEMGVASGPRMREILRALLYARLDGKIRTRREEVETVEAILNTQ